MTSRAYHHKPNGTTYVYEVHSYWDKEKNGPRNKQICLGKLDPATGEIIPSKRRRKLTAAAFIPTPFKAAGQGTTVRQETQAQVAPGISATVLVAGPSLLLDKLAKDTGLASLIRRCFPDFHQEMLSLVYFIVQKGLPLSRSESWSTSHLHPMGKPIASQRISELLLQTNESDRQNFLSLWLKKITDSEYLCYDLTSVSSYAKDNDYIEYGYNRDGESLPQLNLAMLLGQKSGLPAYYRRMPGNINDVSTLKTTMLNLDFLGARGLHFVLDRGFYSQANVNELLARRQHFTMAVPSRRKWIEDIIELYRDSIEYPNNYHQLNDHETLFVKTHLHTWGEDRRRTYLHIYYNAKRAAEDFDRFTSNLLKFKQEVESGKKVAAHQTDYDRFLIIRQTPKRGVSVSFNEPEIRAYRKRYVGFFYVLSSNIKEPMAEYIQN
jgi:hypothetical protein